MTLAMKRPNNRQLGGHVAEGVEGIILELIERARRSRRAEGAICINAGVHHLLLGRLRRGQQTSVRNFVKLAEELGYEVKLTPRKDT